MQLRIPAVYMRGGTSKGVFLRPEDLPADPAARDRLLLRIIGSPDPYGKQIDGMGAATSSTSKVVLISKSKRPDCDVDYLFGQVRIDAPLIDWSGNCGNLTTAVGPFAISEGLVDAPRDGLALVRIWQANIGKRILAHVPVRDGEVVEEGDFELDGVTFPAAEIKLEFVDPGAEGAMFPTGSVIDFLETKELGRVEATLITPRAGRREDGPRVQHGGGHGQAPPHTEAGVHCCACHVHLVQRQEDRRRLHRHAGTHCFDGLAASRHDRHRRRRDRGGRCDPGNAGTSHRSAERRKSNPLRPSFWRSECRRGSALGKRAVDRRQGAHEPQRASADGRMGKGAECLDKIHLSFRIDRLDIYTPKAYSASVFTVIETFLFQKQWPHYWSEEERGKFAAFLAEFPNAGDVIPKSGGIRKVRWRRAGTGKSGGVRVIYFTRTVEEEVVLLLIYAKSKTDNITGTKLKEIRRVLEN